MTASTRKAISNKSASRPESASISMPTGKLFEVSPMGTLILGRSAEFVANVFFARMR